MKGHRLSVRLGFAIAGVRAAWRGEASFRTQGCVAGTAACVLAIVRPSPAWIAITLLAGGTVLALEAANAALEALADALHPAHHPGIGRAKDMAAAAVLIASVAAAGARLCLAYSVFS